MEFKGVEGGNGSFGIFKGGHGDEAEPSRVTSMRVIDHSCFVDLAMLEEKLFEHATVDTAADTGYM